MFETFKRREARIALKRVITLIGGRKQVIRGRNRVKPNFDGVNSRFLRKSENLKLEESRIKESTDRH